MEIKLRNQLQEVYFGKTKDVLNDVRSFGGLGQKSKEEALRRELVSCLLSIFDLVVGLEGIHAGA
jgi:capping protein beta